MAQFTTKSNLYCQLSPVATYQRLNLSIIDSEIRISGPRMFGNKYYANCTFFFLSLCDCHHDITSLKKKRTHWVNHRANVLPVNRIRSKTYDFHFTNKRRNIWKWFEFSVFGCLDSLSEDTFNCCCATDSSAIVPELWVCWITTKQTDDFFIEFQ